MKKQLVLHLLSIVLLPWALPAASGFGQAGTTSPTRTSQPARIKQTVPTRVCDLCIRANEEFLASDAMQGRGSGTHDEFVTATYIASELRQYGIEPAGDNGGYIQDVPTVHRKITSGPHLTITPTGSQSITFDYGKEFLVVDLTQTEFSGPLQKLDMDKQNGPGNPPVQPGAVVLVVGSDQSKVRRAAFSAGSQGAAATLVLASDNRFQQRGTQLPELADQLQGGSPSEMGFFNVLGLNREASQALEKMPDGTIVHFEAQASEEKGRTWNAIGILRGRDPTLQHEAILFSAHLDHLGIGEPVNGDSIYNGADDDASGTTAVLEIARFLGQGRRPRHTVIFALFGSEEMGGLGSTYFREHPPLPLKDIAANLEFEMIGRPDPAVPDDGLWLTGWQRSNLGPALAAHGARLVADPHPRENFFARSDNFLLAKKGIVAQTISSYGLHQDYHQPSDDVAHLDFNHMDAAIGSLLAPVEWLVNSDFRPQWNPGGQP